jgi:hypothetical protein
MAVSVGNDMDGSVASALAPAKKAGFSGGRAIGGVETPLDEEALCDLWPWPCPFVLVPLEPRERSDDLRVRPGADPRKGCES